VDHAVDYHFRSSRFVAGQQHDSHELLRHMLEAVREEEKVISLDCIIVTSAEEGGDVFTLVGLFVCLSADKVTRD